MNPDTLREQIEPMFLEPMQCKPVSALRAGEKWVFELKPDGYRSIAVKRRQGGHALLAPSEGA
jgi:ATP-dependent DNA ligase